MSKNLEASAMTARFSLRIALPLTGTKKRAEFDEIIDLHDLVDILSPENRGKLPLVRNVLSG